MIFLQVTVGESHYDVGVQIRLHGLPVIAFPGSNCVGLDVI